MENYFWWFMGNSPVIIIDAKNHKRSEAVGQKEIFKQWMVSECEKTNLETVVNRQIEIMPIEHSTLLTRRSFQMKIKSQVFS